MKILKDNTAKEYTCTYCQSILEVSKQDLHTTYSEYDGTCYTSDYFYCPCCGEQNFVN